LSTIEVDIFRIVVSITEDCRFSQGWRCSFPCPRHSARNIRRRRFTSKTGKRVIKKTIGKIK